MRSITTIRLRNWKAGKGFSVVATNPDIGAEPKDTSSIFINAGNIIAAQTIFLCKIGKSFSIEAVHPPAWSCKPNISAFIRYATRNNVGIGIIRTFYCRFNNRATGIVLWWAYLSMDGNKNQQWNYVTDLFHGLKIEKNDWQKKRKKFLTFSLNWNLDENSVNSKWLFLLSTNTESRKISEWSLFYFKLISVHYIHQYLS